MENYNKGPFVPFSYNFQWSGFIIRARQGDDFFFKYVYYNGEGTRDYMVRVMYK